MLKGVNRAVRRWGVFCTFLVVGGLLLGAYVHFEPYDGRSRDRGSHFAYISVLQRRRAVPAAGDCWECHQPPAYYALAAGVLALTHTELPPENHRDKEVYPGARALQALGGAIALGTLVVWLLTARMVLKGYEQVIASALLAFWPTLAIDGTPTSNDGLVCLFMSATLALLVWWRQTGRATALVAAAAMAGLSCHIKINGLVAVPIFVTCLVATVALVGPGWRRWPRGGALALVVLASLVGAWFYTLFHWKQGQYKIDFATLGARPLPVEIHQFVYPGLDTFSKTPFVIWDGKGSDLFWNFLFRSSLFGEFGSDDAGTKVYGTLLVLCAAALLPLVLVGVVVSFVRGLRRDDNGHRELLVALLGLVLFLISLYVKYPYRPHNDFRFILPAALPGAIMCALGAGRLRRKLGRRAPHLAALPAIVTVIFCALSTHILLVWP